MSIIKNFSLVLLGIFISGPAFSAATKCVNLTTTTTCSSTTSAGATSDWTSTCGGVSVYGVAICSSLSASPSVGSKRDAIPVSSTSDANKYCWCKMVRPAVSSWVSVYAFPSTTNCLDNCARSCSNYAPLSTSEWANFYYAMFSGMAD